MNAVESFLNQNGMAWHPVKSEAKTLDQLTEEFISSNQKRTFCSEGFEQRDVLVANLFGTEGRIFVSDWKKFSEVFGFEKDYSWMPDWLGQLVFFYGNIRLGMIEVGIAEKQTIKKKIENYGENISEELWKLFPEYQLKKMFNKEQALRYLVEKQKDFLECYYAELTMSRALRTFNRELTKSLDDLLEKKEAPAYLLAN